MSYLFWTSSRWYAYGHAYSGGSDEAFLIAWHAQGACAAVNAGELLRAGSEKRLEQLRALMWRQISASEPAKTAAMEDIDALAPAVDQFLLDIHNTRKIPMPRKVANRYRVLARLIYETVNGTQTHCEQAVDSRDFPTWFAWSAELDEIERLHRRPRLSRDVRDPMHPRALRMLRGEHVSLKQNRLERVRVAAASE